MAGAPAPRGQSSRCLPARPALHVIATDDVLARSTFMEDVRAVLQGLAALGARGVLHLRIRQLEGRPYVALVQRVLDAASSGSTLIAVNGRVDVALAAGAHAVQLGRGALAPADVRLAEARGQRRAQALRRALRVGVSVHPDEPFPDAGATGWAADWILFGHVFATPSHPGVPGCGLAVLRDAARRAGATPLVAIGGIGPGRAAGVLRAGATGIAVVSGIWSEGDPKCNVLRYLSAYADAGGTGRGARDIGDCERDGSFGS